MSNLKKKIHAIKTLYKNRIIRSIYSNNKKHGIFKNCDATIVESTKKIYSETFHKNFPRERMKECLT